MKTKIDRPIPMPKIKKALDKSSNFNGAFFGRSGLLVIKHL